MRPFLLGLSFFRTALPLSGGLSPGDAVEVNCYRLHLLKIKEQVPGIWAKGCVFGDWVSIL